MKKSKNVDENQSGHPGDQKSGNTHGRNARGANQVGCNAKCYGNQDKQMLYDGPQPVIEGLVFDYTGECTPDHFIKAIEGIHNYVGTNYKKYMTESTTALEDLELNDPVEPTVHDPAEHIALEHWKVQYQCHDEKIQEYVNFRSGLYSLVYSQFTQVMRECRKSHHNRK